MIQLGTFFTTLLWIVLILVAAAVFLLIAGSRYFKWYFSWELKNRRGMTYYGRPLGSRRSFKQRIRMHAFFLKPVVYLETRLRRKMGVQDIASINYQGVWGPSFSCTPESFENAAIHRASSNEVFIVTQMKCGTTWMQQLAFQILTRGRGVFNDGKYRHLSAISPWIEAIDGISISEAPLIGTPGRKIVKTHLPAELCPFSEQARYIYVVRHPVSCFSSIMDYFRLTAGPFAPSERRALEWFCSDQMWWRPWPDHVSRWWERSKNCSNVFFTSFESMKTDLPAVIESLGAFLGQELETGRRNEIADKSSFDYMKQHEEYFEMVPPNLFSVEGTYFKSGRLDRDKDVSETARETIFGFCRQQLGGRDFPIERFYPDAAPDR